MSHHSLVERFLAAMRYAGIEPDATIHADGRIHRFRDWLDKPATRDGWYILFSDFPPAGAFGSWRSGIKVIWHDTGPEDNRLWVRNRDRIEEVLEKQHKTGRHQAEAIWINAQPSNGKHRYLLRKRIQSHGLRYYRGALLVPVQDAHGALHGLQQIYGDGNKRFTQGTNKMGHFFLICAPQNDRVYLAEGYATAATIHEITGNTVAVAFDCFNLPPVAMAVQNAFPGSELVICADNDRFTPGNPGLTKASEAAQVTGGHLVQPVFSAPTSPGSDFNDLFVQEGEGAVLRSLLNAGGA